MVWVLALALGISSPIGHAAAPSGSDLSRCARIAAANERLACYDALAGRPVDTGTHEAASPSSSVRAAPLPRSVPPTAHASDPADFGLSAAQLNPAPKGAAAEQAHIANFSIDGLGHGRIELDNGQLWALSDAEAAGDARLNAGDPVSIRRAALGSFLMMTASNHAYHVHRLR